MKTLIVLMFLGLTLASATTLTPGLCVRYGIIPGFNFFDIPRTIADAKSNDWVETTPPNGTVSTVVLYCAPETVVCGIYDADLHYIVGTQYSVPKDELKNNIYDMKIQGFSEWTPNSDGVTYWCIKQLFVSPAIQNQSLEVRTANYDNNDTVRDLWLTGFNGNMDQIPMDQTSIENSIFTKQHCFLMMGTHYFYNMSSTIECRSDTLYPWFLLVNSRRVIGTGLLVFGFYNFPKSGRVWHERPPSFLSHAIISNGSDCYYDLASDPGMVSLHTWFIKHPSRLGCIG